MKYDIAIIGGGPGGYVAAIRGAQLGAKVALIEKDEVGGVCLNRGCIPTKALIASGEMLKNMTDSRKFGLKLEGEIKADFTEVMARKNKIVNVQVGGIKSLLKSNNVDLIKAKAKFEGKNTLSLDVSGNNLPDQVEAEKIIIATGSESISLPGLSLDGNLIISSDDALNLTQLPGEILIVGAGVIGSEFGLMFNNFGCKVTLVEMLESALPFEDKEISTIIEREFKKRKIRLLTGQKIEKITPINDKKVKAETSNGESIEADKILVSIGRKFNTGGIGLEQIGVKMGNRGNILVDDFMETNIKGIYAVGDVSGEPFYAHKASYEGIVAVKNALGAKDKGEKEVIPYGIFTHPEIGGVGISEQEAMKRDLDYKVGRFNFRALGRAHTLSEIDGLVKVISSAKDDRIVGVRIIGAFASEIVHTAACAMKFGIKARELADMIYSHPTMSEGLMEALHDIHGQAIHVMK
ncbi:dihydrolipoyl dehydrogenase [bacterium]|nr:dihydrolipoyl dehydrogenase [bacterium]